MSRGERLDQELVHRGLVEGLVRAHQLISAGDVLVDEVVWDKAGSKVRPEQVLRVRSETLPFVSRGGLKLQAALETFGVRPQGRTCADLGASTGGFTDCLLQAGAARVYAVDVGYGQLAWKLRQDPRVVTLERTNVRHLPGLPEPISLVVGDLSFISLHLILPAIVRLAPDEAVLLVKPQFEVRREDLGKGGLVRTEEARSAAVASVAAAARTAGFEVAGQRESPITGNKSGNVEWLLWLRQVPAPPTVRG